MIRSNIRVDIGYLLSNSKDYKNCGRSTRMAEYGTEVENQIAIIRSFRRLIEEWLIPTHITSHLLPFIKQDVAKKIQTRERSINGPKAAAGDLLDILEACKEPGWYKAFIVALKDEGYDHLAAILEGDKQRLDPIVFRNLLDAFACRIVKDVEADEIVDDLLQKETISREDYRNIKRETQQNGNRDAMMLLLSRLPVHTNYWFADFIAVLKNSEKDAYKQLAGEIEPCISKACPSEEYEISEKIQEQNQIGLNQHIDSEDIQPSTSGTCEMETEEIAEEHFYTSCPEKEQELFSPNIPNDNQATSSLVGHMSQSDSVMESSQSASCLQTTDVTNDLTGLSSLPGTSDGLMMNNLLENAQLEKKVEKYLPLHSNNLTNESNSREEDLIDDVAETPMEQNDDTQIEELTLRNYQMELAKKAVNDQNVIIIAPTGSGKTHVALYITKKHLEHQEEGKVVFFVPTVELVTQQWRMYQKYLSNYKTYGICGDVSDSQRVPLSDLLDLYQIIIMTPQILVDNINKKNISSVSVFTLMIFDECHHANKDHPYNMIMGLHHYLKRSQSGFPPQVVGLTASVGVGKARDIEGAKTHILSLCANLDAQDISTVEEYASDLDNFANKPNTDKIETTGRKQDPFRREINEIMATIEKRMQTIIEKQNSPEFIVVKTILQSPSQRGDDPYVQWHSRLMKSVCLIQDPHSHRPLFACLAHLKVYNLSLRINEDCRTKDAMIFICSEFKEIAKPHKDETDLWLDKLFAVKKPFLETISNDPTYDNPKLAALCNVIMDKYNEENDMRAIIFCKTRDMTLALCNWMKETPGLSDLNPEQLVGGNTSVERGGMNRNRQEDVLKQFKIGGRKILVATSVAEEGLDVSKCNLVIKYEYVTNEIAMVQSRGRGRAENSEYLVLGDVTRGASQKEHLNQIRETMMNKAIKLVRQMPDDVRQHAIQDLQRSAQQERSMNEAGKKFKESHRSNQRNDDWQLLCRKCQVFACLSTDIRKVEESHHVVIDREFKQRLIIESHPDSKNIGDLYKTDKIFCKNCKEDWGIQAIYKASKFCVIKINSFIMNNIMTSERQMCKKWRDVKFPIEKLTPTELEQHSMPTISD